MKELSEVHVRHLEREIDYDCACLSRSLQMVKESVVVRCCQVGSKIH